MRHKRKQRHAPLICSTCGKPTPKLYLAWPPGTDPNLGDLVCATCALARQDEVFHNLGAETPAARRRVRRLLNDTARHRHK